MIQKFLIVSALVLFAGVTGIKAQTSSCGLNLEVTESNIDGLPIQKATAIAVNLSTGKTSKASEFEGMPVFGNLRAGKYKITVARNGYKPLVKQIDVDCRNLEPDDRTVTANVFLTKNSRKVKKRS